MEQNKVKYKWKICTIVIYSVSGAKLQKPNDIAGSKGVKLSIHKLDLWCRDGFAHKAIVI